MGKRSKIIVGAGTIMVAAIASLTFYNLHAHALSQTVINGLEGGRAPRASQFSVGNDVYLEISQKSSPSSTSLNAPENWTKLYYEANKKSTAIIGIYHGAFTGCEPDYSPGGCLSGSTSVDYELYASNPNGTKPDPQVAPEFIDDQPCRNPFKTVNSSQLSTGWDGVNLASYIKGGCDGKDIVATPKTGRVVIYVRAKWRGENIERTNAFKVGAAYQDGGSGLAGYWSRYDKSVTRDPADLDTSNPTEFSRGLYAVQDRIGRTGDGLRQQGDYSFGFGPDCYLGKNEDDPRPRFLKWYDVDLNYYPPGRQPYFELVDVTDRSNEQKVTLTGAGGETYQRVEGSALGAPGGNGYRQLRFQGKGGHTYAWRWKNIIKTDGMVFWMPYDDFPFLNNGCGKYNQSLELWSGRNGGAMSKGPNLKAAGGETLNFRIDQDWSAPNQPAAAPRTTTDAFLSTRRGSYDGTFSGVPTNINLGGSRYQGNRDQIRWVLPGLGPNPPYANQRSLQYSYPIKPNAVDGSVHCFNAKMNNETSNNPPAHAGNIATSNTICYTIDNSLKPFVSTTGADVHAGDCSVTVDGKFTGLDGKITGPPANGGTIGSSGSYIVSAGDAITNFGSAGSASGGALTFGKGGKYGAICRPKMSTIDENFRKDTAETLNAPAAGTTLNLSTLEGGHRYKMKVTGDIRVSGQSNSTITIYATGQVALTNSPGGPVVGANTSFPAARSKLPVVGIVANSIVIGQSVTTVNAVMYAQNTINTCSISDWVNQCKSTLTVKGFAMAGDFLFRRVSPFANSLQVGEQIDFNAAFYLNPPPGFGLPANQIKYLGEKAPLY